MAKPELGIKRTCQSCGAKFYDLSRNPIVCPRCDTIFQPIMGRGRPEPVAAVVDDEEAEAEVTGPEIVSLEEVEAEESAKEVADDDVEIEDDLAADDAFLEEEEVADDDVADLIDGDLADDEET